LLGDNRDDGVRATAAALAGVRVNIMTSRFALAFAGAMLGYFARTITSIAPLTTDSSSLRGTRARARIAMV
jgi:hypothetical protein